MLIFGDPHIEEPKLAELEEVFNEIYKRLTTDEVIICLGDYYHSKRPTAKELDFGSYWVNQFQRKASKVIMLRGNHVMVNYKQNYSSVEYLKRFGVTVCEDYTFDNMYFGHKMTEKSYMYFGLQVPNHERYDIPLKRLRRYDYALLGHQHQFQKLTDKIYHLGSIIYTNFSELNTGKKYIAKLFRKNLGFIELKTPIPMVEVDSIDKLDDINQDTKVRLVFNSFGEFKRGVNRIEDYKHKFYQFKIKLNFTDKKGKVEEIKEKKSLSEIIDNWLQTIKDKDVRRELENEIVCLRDA
jgi:DNA repair exonuclease SbcCD nuclease subunit